jgi:predicted acylesterase/phospholipase RssA
MIKHIVINGGGPTGLITYGVLKHLSLNHFFDINNIESIYGTSIGGIFAVILSLKYDWQTLDDYILKRPWEKIFKIHPEDFFNLFYSKGLFSFNIVEGFLGKLFEALDISLNITLKEFYEFTKIKHHFITVKADTLECVELSYKTFPDLPLIKALEMTTAFPIFCKPVFYEDICYIDGGLLNNYPVKNCLENEGCEKEEILGIKNTYPINTININEKMNLLEYLQSIFGKIINRLQTLHNSECINIPNEVKCYCDKNITNYETWLNNLIEIDKRRELVDYGINCAIQFLEYQKQLC